MMFQFNKPTTAHAPVGTWGRKMCIALAPAFAQTPPMLARVLSAVNGIEAFPVEVEVNSGRWDTTVVIMQTIRSQAKPRKTGIVKCLTTSPIRFPTAHAGQWRLAQKGVSGYEWVGIISLPSHLLSPRWL
jgi:hypothetical protein